MSTKSFIYTLCCCIEFLRPLKIHDLSGLELLYRIEIMKHTARATTHIAGIANRANKGKLASSIGDPV